MQRLLQTTDGWPLFHFLEEIYDAEQIPLFSLYSYKTSTVAVIAIMYLLMGWDPYHMANKIRNAERSTEAVNTINTLLISFKSP